MPVNLPLEPDQSWTPLAGEDQYLVARAKFSPADPSYLTVRFGRLRVFVDGTLIYEHHAEQGGALPSP